MQFATGIGNDGILEGRLAVSRDGRTAKYVDAPNAREPFLPLGVNRCDELQPAEYPAGVEWCANDATMGKSDFDASEIYTAAGYALGDGGESVIVYYGGMVSAYYCNGRCWVVCEILRTTACGFVVDALNVACRRILTARAANRSPAATTQVSALLDSGSTVSSRSMLQGFSTCPACHTHCRALQPWSSLSQLQSNVLHRPITRSRVAHRKRRAVSRFPGTSVRTCPGIAPLPAKLQRTARRRCSSHCPVAHALASRCSASAGSALTPMLPVAETCAPPVKIRRRRPNIL